MRREGSGSYHSHARSTCLISARRRIRAVDPRRHENQSRSEAAGRLLFRRGHPVFAVFDAFWLDGEDLRSMPLLARKQRLAAVVPAWYRPC
jgi:hypothetical protein